MDLGNRHPLNAIEGYENLSMLEALIPFVDYSLKLPLALFIKFSEIRLIINCLQTKNNLARMGLHYANTDPLDMVCALTGVSPDILKMLFSIMNNGEGDLFSMINTLGGNSSDFTAEQVTNMMNQMQSMQNCSNYDFNQNSESGTFHCQNTDNYDFDLTMQNIFAQYDEQQAAKAASYEEEYPSYSSHTHFPR